MSKPRPPRPNQTFGNPHENYSSPQSVQPSSARKADPQPSAPPDSNANSSSPMNFGAGYGVGGMAQLFTLLSALGVLAVGIIHIINLFKGMKQTACSNNNTASSGTDCIGTSLYWKVSGVKPYSSDLNGFWRYGTYTLHTDNNTYYYYTYAAGPFTFTLDDFADNWTPIVLGALACLQLIYKTRWEVVSGTWLRCLLFHIVMMLVCCFGYSGQAGIVVGFVVAFTGLLCLICALCRDESTCYFTFKLSA